MESNKNILFSKKHLQLSVSLSILCLLLSCQIEDSSSLNKTELSESFENHDDDTKSFVFDYPPYKITFQEEQTFGSTEEIYFKNIGQFAVDNRDRVYIADRHDIKLFDLNGNYIKTLGRWGRGPGEFNNFGALSIGISLNKLFVFDRLMSRINVFDLNSLVYENVISVNPRSWNLNPKLSITSIKNFKPLNDSVLVVGIINSSDIKNKFINYFLMNNKGEIVPNPLFSYSEYDTFEGIGVPKPIAPNAPIVFPTNRSSIIQTDISSGDQIYSVWTNNLIIYKHDINGEILSVIKYEYENAAINPDDVRSEYDYHKLLYARSKRQAIDEDWPAIHHFFIDDEKRIWVSTITDDEKNFQWYVLSNRGELIGSFKWRGERLKRHYVEREIRTVKNGYLYTKETDTETLESRVVKYKIVFKERE